MITNKSIALKKLRTASIRMMLLAAELTDSTCPDAIGDVSHKSEWVVESKDRVNKKENDFNSC